MNLETSRLALVPTPLHAVRLRLAEDAFHETVDTPSDARQIAFSAEWPGDPLQMFPSFAEWLEANPAAEPWGGVVLLCDTRDVVGQAGFEGGPDADGVVELGRGIHPSLWNRGLATEIVAELAGCARADDRICVEKVETDVHHVASRRELEKPGVRVTDQRDDPEDGSLELWVWTT